MLKELLNKAINSYVAYKTKSDFSDYHRYPKNKTALIFIDVDDVFLADEYNLKRRLKKLLKFSRKMGFGVIYSSFNPSANIKYKTRAHNYILNALSGNVSSPKYPSELVSSGDVINLNPMNGLSAFSNTRLANVLADQGYEHLILVGPLTNITVDSTLRDATQLDFHVTILTDCLGKLEEDSTAAALDYTMPRYAQSMMLLSEFMNLAAEQNAV